MARWIFQLTIGNEDVLVLWLIRNGSVPSIADEGAGVDGKK
jgi:hypothetical protein